MTYITVVLMTCIPVVLMTYDIIVVLMRVSGGAVAESVAVVLLYCGSTHLGSRWCVQISDIQVNGQSDNMTAKEKLLLWSQRMVEGYQGLRCDNFTTCWRDGKLFNAVIHKHR